MVTRRIDFGSASSHVDLNCNGATLANQQIGSKPFDFYRLTIRTGYNNKNNTFKQLVGATVRNCIVHGGIAVGSTMSADTVRASSRRAGHVGRMQAVSAKSVSLDNLTIMANPLPDGSLIRNILYVQVGVTDFLLQNSSISGEIGDGLPIYLDAESARNSILNNVFNVVTRNREYIALDGSSDNSIRGNTFVNPRRGAIYVYRNCGETGIVRHNEPRRNVVENNVFRFTRRATATVPVVWVASREKSKTYQSWCDLDKGVPFGSGVSDRDFAKGNIIRNNRFVGVAKDHAVVVDDPENVQEGNVLRSSKSSRGLRRLLSR